MLFKGKKPQKQEQNGTCLQRFPTPSGMSWPARKQDKRHKKVTDSRPGTAYKILKASLFSIQSNQKVLMPQPSPPIFRPIHQQYTFLTDKPFRKRERSLYTNPI